MVRKYMASMYKTHPWQSRVDTLMISRTAAITLECAATCTICADACLGEGEMLQLRGCIRANLDCADICLSTSRVLSRITESNWDTIGIQLDACRRTCEACADECMKHEDMHEHCRLCAEMCRRCAQVCHEATDGVHEFA